MSLANSKMDLAISWLLIGAIFFAMRSCEYLTTSSREESKRMKILRIKIFRFKTKQGNTIPLNSSSDRQTLHHAELVIITFEFQKNKSRNKSVHMYRTNDKVLNPVIAWASTIQRLFQTIPTVSGETKVCEFLSDDKIIDIDSALARTKLRAVVDLLGESALGIGKDDIGTHSIRSGGAMAMFLSGVNEIIIQRVGRWLSQAFLEYIRDQVDSFTVGVSQKMLKFESYHHLNDEETEKINEGKPDKSQLSEIDGVDHIPFTVHYSTAIIENESDLCKQANE